jgi:protein TonB
LARQARIQGVVILDAVIAKDGSVDELKVISGHPLLTGAAIDAVKQWKYKPTTLNGEPVEVQTTITVTFSFGG